MSLTWALWSKRCTYKETWVLWRIGRMWFLRRSWPPLPPRIREGWRLRNSLVLGWAIPPEYIVESTQHIFTISSMASSCRLLHGFFFFFFFFFFFYIVYGSYKLDIPYIHTYIHTLSYIHIHIHMDMENTIIIIIIMTGRIYPLCVFSFISRIAPACVLVILPGHCGPSSHV